MQTRQLFDADATQGYLLDGKYWVEPLLRGKRYIDEAGLLKSIKIDEDGHVLLGSLSCAIYKNRVNVPEVRHGRWIHKNSYIFCSECGEPNIEWNYCPNCGAKMDGEKE